MTRDYTGGGSNNRERYSMKHKNWYNKIDKQEGFIPEKVWKNLIVAASKDLDTEPEKEQKARHGTWHSAPDGKK